jgi:acetyl esterase
MVQVRKIYFFCIAIFFQISAVSYKNVDPKMAHFLQDLAKQDGPPIYTLSPQKARKVLDDFQVPSVGILSADVQDIMIPDSSKKSQKISLRMIRPVKSKNKKLPVVIFMHGGGWILGNQNTHDYLVRTLAREAQVAVVFVNFTLSPEAHYPGAIDQGYEALTYIAQHGKKLNLDSKKIAIAGDSVGGLMATAIAQLAKERSGPKIMFQLLFYPVTDAHFDTASYKEFAEGFWLSKKSMEWFWDAYAPKVSERANYHVSPLQSSLDQLHGMPPALIITNENDVLRDEGEAYAKKLMQAGADVVAMRMLGTIHDFVMLDPLKNTPEAKAALDFAACQLKKVFYK